MIEIRINGFISMIPEDLWTRYINVFGDADEGELKANVIRYFICVMDDE